MDEEGRTKKRGRIWLRGSGGRKENKRKGEKSGVSIL